MPTLFQQIQAGKVWDFHGGIHPPSRKERTNQKPVALLDIPDRLYIPLRQHIGVAGKVQRAKQLSEAYQIDGVPSLGVAGQYYTSGTQAKSLQRALGVVEQLADFGRKG